MTQEDNLKARSSIDVFEEQWSGMSGVADWDNLSEEVYRALRSAIGEPRGLKLAEVGCGTARISARLAEDGAQVVALDASPSAIAIAADQFARRGLSAGVVEGDLFDLPFQTASFDAVWSSGVMEHFEDKDLLLGLREAMRVTRPGGLVITLVPSSLAIGYRIAIWRGQKTGSWPNGLERSFRTLRKHTEAAGLVTEKEWRIAPAESAAFFAAHAAVRGLRKPAKLLLAPLRYLGLADYLLVNLARRPPGAVG